MGRCLAFALAKQKRLKEAQAVVARIKPGRSHLSKAALRLLKARLWYIRWRAFVKVKDFKKAVKEASEALRQSSEGANTPLKYKVLEQQCVLHLDIEGGKAMKPCEKAAQHPYALPRAKLLVAVSKLAGDSRGLG